MLLNSTIQEAYVLLEALLKQRGNTDLLDELRFVKGKDGSLLRINNSEGTISVKRIAEETVELRLVTFANEPTARMTK